MKRVMIGLMCLLLNAAGTFAAYWTVNPHAYRYDMTVYAVLQVNGMALDDYSDYEVAVFNGDECRGVAKVQSASDGTSYLYLRVYSNEPSGETLHLQAYQEGTKTEIFLPETINFVAEGMVGTPGEPLILTMTQLIVGDVNGDGAVTPSDAIMTLYHFFNVQQQGFNVEAADVNGDGNVTPADAIDILYMYFGTSNTAARQDVQMLIPQ